MSAAGKLALLFLSPLMPDVGGNGLAMRAGATLEALAADYEVHLLVTPLASAGAASSGAASSAGRRARPCAAGARASWCTRPGGTSTRFSS